MADIPSPDQQVLTRTKEFKDRESFSFADPLPFESASKVQSKFKQVSQTKPPPLEEISEPSYIREFKDCTSVYQIPNKVDEEEISSDGEFRDARHLKVLDESCTEVFLIEKQNEYETQNGRSMPSHLEQQAKAEKHNGAKAKRDHGMKHFTKVAFTQGDTTKPVPRWAADPRLLN